MRYSKIRARESLPITPLIWKKVKTLKEKVIFDHICRKGHNPTFDDFETLVKDFNEIRHLLREEPLITLKNC